MNHELKCLPEFFQALWVGDKTFEIRKNDRNFKERDEVTLLEWESQPTIDTPSEPGEPFNGEYTGREICGVITYLTDYEQKPGFVVFSFRETRRSE